MNQATLTLIGGPTLLIEIGGLRLLTDPTFDPAGSVYSMGPVQLEKRSHPACSIQSLGHIDAVLLSHEQHPDNLDKSGRAMLSSVGKVFTTQQSAVRLGPHAVGMRPWETAYLATADGRLIITATPARHGPHGAEAYSGEVTGFVLTWAGTAGSALYISGDTVWYEGVAETARRFKVGLALLNLGAARIEQVGPVDLTMNAEGAVQAVRAFGDATIVPAHYEGWAHFSEPQEEVARIFERFALTNRLHWLEPGVATTLLY